VTVNARYVAELIVIVFYFSIRCCHEFICVSMWVLSVHDWLSVGVWSFRVVVMLMLRRRAAAVYVVMMCLVSRLNLTPLSRLSDSIVTSYRAVHMSTCTLHVNA